MDTLLEISGLVIGLLYLWWEYHANPKMWIASVIMPAISMWIYFSKGLYADFGINIYYLVIAAYGYWAWTQGKGHRGKADGTSGGHDLPVTHITVPVLWGTLVAFGAVWLTIYTILVHFTDSSVPGCDSFTTALSIVAMWMLARKYAEQWLAWIIVDAVCVGLYIYKGIYFYAALYSVYTIVAIFGYRKWIRMIR